MAHFHPSVAIISLGCPKNLVDGEVMAARLGQAGFILAGRERSADVIVVNTCAFIGPAREEAWEVIGRAARIRRRGRPRALIVAGCLAQGFAADIVERFPEVDAVLGTAEVEAVAGVAKALLEGSDFVPETPGAQPSPPGYLPKGPSVRYLSTPPHYAYLKIAEGCDHRCSFCLIPSLRGPYRSRPPSDIVAEAKELEARGVKELVLVAQDTTAYGRDVAGRSLLASLVRDIMAQTEIAWVRTLYGYPSALPDDFVSLLAESASEAASYPDGRVRLCRYLDLPMQHASDPVLKAMRRPETEGFLLRLVERLRREVPGITLRSTFILGFPGEREKDVDRLSDFLREARMERVGFFTYSPEAGTPAAGLPGQVPEEAKRERLSRVALVQRQVARAANEGLVNRRMKVLVDRSDGSVVLARGERDAPEIDGNVKFEARDATGAREGSFREALITGAGPYDLDGILL